MNPGQTFCSFFCPRFIILSSVFRVDSSIFPLDQPNLFANVSHMILIVNVSVEVVVGFGLGVKFDCLEL